MRNVSRLFLDCIARVNHSRLGWARPPPKSAQPNDPLSESVIGSHDTGDARRDRTADCPDGKSPAAAPELRAQAVLGKLMASQRIPRRESAEAEKCLSSTSDSSTGEQISDHSALEQIGSRRIV